jgi:hypothetical protein
MPSVQPDAPANPRSTPPTKRRTSHVVALVFAVLVVIGIARAAGDSDVEPAPSPDNGPVAAVPEVPAAGIDPVLPEDSELPGDGVAQTAVVPDVVGLNHQLAQDTLQASGFYLLLEEDAGGLGRMLLYDRNWAVVSQSVPAGTEASTTEPITLYSEKIGE